VKTDGIHVPDPQVLTSSPARLDEHPGARGALTRVVAFSSLTGEPMTVDLSQDVLKDVFPQGEAAAVSIKRIQDLVAERVQPSHSRSSAATSGRRTSSIRARSRCTSRAS